MNYKLREPESWEKGLSIPIRSFIGMCLNGMYKDSDGHGYLGTHSLITDMMVTPSTVIRMDDMKILKRNFTHVWWHGN